MFKGQSVLAALMQLAIVLFLSPPLIAQSSRVTGELTGTISDNTGAVVPQAAVIATDAATNQQRTAVSDDAGHFTFHGLHDGIYSVRVHRDGFADTVRPTVTVTIGGVAQLDVTLKPASSTQEVTMPMRRFSNHSGPR